MAVGPPVPTRFAFLPGEEVERGFIRVLGEIAIEGRRLAPSSHGTNAESVHSTRVLIKRLRALLWFASPAFSASALERPKSDLRKASHLLAAERELAVMRSHLEALARKTSKSADRKVLLRLADAQDNHADNSAKPEQLLRQAAAIVLTVIKVLKQQATGNSHWPSNSERLAKAFRASEKSGKRALRGEHAEQFHDWRKKAKRLLYQLQLAPGIPDERMVQTTIWVDQLQDELGDYHDAVVAQNRLRKFSPDEVSKRLVRQSVHLLEKRKRRLRKQVGKIARHIRW
ncbi:MAG: CHAD domain-containing protein [Chthoniobacter sp.]|uniref:CHAD domain-containing protein n=1 Tax=Chthoniobacter sp. TaxID=2510640 RepID=UPI0032A19879